MNRPVIGVTKSDKRGGVQNLAIRLSLFLSGAKSINLLPQKPGFNKKIDGIVISGGTDLYPDLYKSAELKENYKYERERDKLEIMWLSRAKEMKIPIFCICRGAQLLNVVQGGNLHTDVSKVYENANYPNSLIAKIFFRKKISVKKNTRLNHLVESEQMNVNSLHSQAINEIGRNLKVSAVEDNGVIQGIEMVSKKFIVGLQFHPEFLYYRKEIRNIFKAFVRDCSFT